jgi:hypothetical protein
MTGEQEYPKTATMESFTALSAIAQNLSHIVEPSWFWMDWSRSKIRLVHKKGGFAILLCRRFCANSLPLTRASA